MLKIFARDQYFVSFSDEKVTDFDQQLTILKRRSYIMRIMQQKSTIKLIELNANDSISEEDFDEQRKKLFGDE